MKKAIVTGATGFIGSWVVKELLEHNIQVIAVLHNGSKKGLSISDKNLKIFYCDLCDMKNMPELIPDRDIDTAYHFAWQGVSNADIKDPDIQLANIQATLDLIDILPEIGCSSFVGAGSLHEIEGIYDMSEDKKITNLGYMYKAAKISAHWMGKALAGSKNIRFFWPIISNAYGEGENSGRLINTIIRQIRDGVSPSLSEGYQNYDFVHISDVARAFYLIPEHGIDGANYFIGSGNPKPLREYLNVVGKVSNEMFGTNIPLGFGRSQASVVQLPEFVFDINRLKKDTGYQAIVPFEEGIRRTVQWICQGVVQ